MYCVRCGVRLQEGVKACPLCGTPVWCPEAGERGPAATYSDRYPVYSRQKRLTVMASLTVALLAAMVACFSIALNTTGCAHTGGRWFWTFAFPLTGLMAILTIGAVALYRYVKRGTIFITGGLLIAIGGGCLLAELFQHLTFHTPMFSWSLYAAAVFLLFGGFLILAGIVRPLREHLERKLFI